MNGKLKAFSFLICSAVLSSVAYAQELPSIEFINSLRESNSNKKVVSKEIPTTEDIYFCYEIHSQNDTIIIPSKYVYFDRPKVIDLPKEGFIRFVDPSTNLVGLYNNKGQVALAAKFKDLSQVKNNLVVTLNKHAQDSYVKAIEQVFEQVAFKSSYFYSLVSPYGDILIEDFNYSSMSFDLYSLVVTDVALKSDVYVNFKADDGKWYNFIDRKAYFIDFFTNVFQNSLRDKSASEYLQNNTLVRVGTQEGFVSPTDAHALEYDSLEQQHLVKLEWLWTYLQNPFGFSDKLFNVVYRSDPSFFEEEFFKQPPYLDQNGFWDVDLYPVWTLFIEERFPGGYHIHAIDFYRDKANEIKIARISLSDKKKLY